LFNATTSFSLFAVCLLFICCLRNKVKAKTKKAYHLYIPAIRPCFYPSYELCKPFPIRHSLFVVRLTFLGFEIIFFFNPNQRKCKQNFPTLFNDETIPGGYY